MLETGLRPFASIAELEAMVHEFETCRLPRSLWTHEAHLAVGAWYVSTMPEADATESMIHGIRRYNHANGVYTSPTGGYHETITLFWLVVARETLVALMEKYDLLERINLFIESFSARRELLLDFYDRDRLFSAEARAHWVPPHKWPGGRLAPLSNALKGKV